MSAFSTSRRPGFARACRWRRSRALLALLVVAFVAAPTAGAASGDEVWTDQFGLDSSDWAGGVAVDATGVYVAASVEGALPGQTWRGKSDAAVVKYGPAGTVLWIRQFGTRGDDQARAVAVDTTGVYVVGTTAGTLPGQTPAGLQDIFIRKFSFGGAVLWTRQFGTSDWDSGDGVATFASGVYVVGAVGGTLPGQATAGSTDAFLRKYSADGIERWTRQFGTEGWDAAWAVTADATGAYVVGQVDGALPGQVSAGFIDAFARKYGARGGLVWTRQFGGAGFDDANGVAAGSTGVYVVGSTEGMPAGQARNGYETSAYVRKLGLGGALRWYREFGTEYPDSARAVAADDSGAYVTGETSGIFPGLTGAGNQDVFVRQYRANGTVAWTGQFGTYYWDTGMGVAVGDRAVYAVGRVEGSLPGETWAGGFDVFVRKMDR